MKLEFLLTGGDRLPAIDVKDLSFRLINNYGPTENTVVTSYYEIEAKDALISPPIGRPIDNVSVYLIDQYNQLAPVGVVGELCIAGASLAIGYLNQEDLTKDSLSSESLSKQSDSNDLPPSDQEG